MAAVSARLRLLLPLLVAPATAWGNGASIPDSLRVALRPGDPVTLGIEANFGLLDAPDGETFTWICHETLLSPTSTLTPAYFRSADDVFFATVKAIGVANVPDASFFRSADGCAWDAPYALREVVIRDLAIDPADPDHLLAASSTGAGQMNGLWVSTDGGIAWSTSPLFMADRYFRSVRWSPTDPLVVWAAANWYTPSAQAWIYRSADGGGSFTEHPWSFTFEGLPQTSLEVVAVSPTDGLTAFVRTDATTDHLLLTTNGGVSFASVLQVVGDIRGAVHDGSGRLWVSTTTDAVYRSTDGRTFIAVDGAPRANGMAVDERGLFLATNNFTFGAALAVTTDGGSTYTGLFRFDQLQGPRPCPDGSSVKTICDPLWPALAQRLGIETPTPTPEDENGGDGGGGGCGCSVPPASGATVPAAVVCLAAAGIALAARRRRRGGEPSPAPRYRSR